MIRLLVLLIGGLAGVAWAAELDPLIDPAKRIAPDDPAWRALAAVFARQPDATADFSERRFFPFKTTPVELKGESRVSAERGLSLHYTAPEERTVILDVQGVLVRDARGEMAAPADPRAGAAQAALGQVLRFDLPSLAGNFDLFGEREGAAWRIAFVPRAADLRRAIGAIIVAGGADAVSRIELRRSAKQYVAILIGPARRTPFGAEELKQFFR